MLKTSVTPRVVCAVELRNAADGERRKKVIGRHAFVGTSSWKIRDHTTEVVMQAAGWLQDRHAPEAGLACSGGHPRLHYSARATRLPSARCTDTQRAKAFMTDSMTRDQLAYPFAAPPANGEVIEVAPGILWTRIALPFQLNHVNIYMLDDGDGWAVLDTGIDNDATRAAWEALAAGPLAGRRVTRLIVTHFHPDHIGLAGWLCERFDIPLLTTQTSYLGCLNISLSPGALDAKPYRDFYLRHGLDAVTTKRVDTQRPRLSAHGVAAAADLPRIVGGDELEIGGRTFARADRRRPCAGTGDALVREEKIFLAADQVLAKISPNVSVWAVDPRRRSARPLHPLAQCVQERCRKTRSCCRGINCRSTACTRAARELIAPSRGALRGDRRRLPRAPALRGRFRAGAVPPRARPAPDELRLLRSAGACELHAAASAG